jgi:serine/threonine protein kinase
MRHPNIVRVFDHGDYEGERFLAMEQLHGQEIGATMKVLTAQGAPASGFGAFVAREVCRALDYVHTLRDEAGAPLNLMHRDVSLSNVMLGFDGSVKLLDFGVAKALADQRSQQTQAGVIKGKWGYLAPEQVMGAAVDQRADLFSLGVVLWEMLTGRRLFKGQTGLETLDQVRAAAVLPPSTVNPLVPPALDAVCRKALARLPEDRFASAAEMAAALDKVVETLGFDASRLAQQMAMLFPADATAFGEAQRATPPAGTRVPESERPTVPVMESVVPDDELMDTLLSPRVTVEELAAMSPPMARRAQSRGWIMLLAAALAMVMGAMTGWQIASAAGGG